MIDLPEPNPGEEQVYAFVQKSGAEGRIAKGACLERVLEGTGQRQFAAPHHFVIGAAAAQRQRFKANRIIVP